MADDILKNPPLVATCITAFESIRGQLKNLEQTIADLLDLEKSLPEGESRNRLLDEISALDSIADVIREALDMALRQTDAIR